MRYGPSSAELFEECLVPTFMLPWNRRKPSILKKCDQIRSEAVDWDRAIEWNVDSVPTVYDGSAHSSAAAKVQLGR